MKKATGRLVLGLIAGVLVFAGLSIYADAEALGERLGTYAWSSFFVALALAVLNYGIRFIRWQLYLKRRDVFVRTPLSLTIFLSGFALSVTPGKVGELLKSYLLRQTRGYPIATTAPIVVAERITDLVALIVLGGIGVLLYDFAPAAKTTVVVSLIFVGGALAVLSWRRLTLYFIELLTRPRKLARFRDRLLHFYEGLGDLVTIGPLSWATALAVLAWLAECIGFGVIIGGFPGTNVSFGAATLIYATTTVAGALSFLPGGLLVTEATMILFLVKSSAGLDDATAAAATILTRLATLWFAVVLGLAALGLLRRVAPNTRDALEPPENADILQE